MSSRESVNAVRWKGWGFVVGRILQKSYLQKVPFLEILSTIDPTPSIALSSRVGVMDSDSGTDDLRFVWSDGVGN